MQRRQTQVDRIFTILDILSTFPHTRRELLDSLALKGYSIGERQLRRDVDLLFNKQWIFVQETPTGKKFKRNFKK